MTTRSPKKKTTTSVTDTMAFPTGTFLSVKQVAEIRGCSTAAVYDSIESGALPAYRWNDKPGASIRIKVDDVYTTMTPVIPEPIMADLRSRMPSPLHVPVDAGDGGAR